MKRLLAIVAACSVAVGLLAVAWFLMRSSANEDVSASADTGTVDRTQILLPEAPHADSSATDTRAIIGDVVEIPHYTADKVTRADYDKHMAAGEYLAALEAANALLKRSDLSEVERDELLLGKGRIMSVYGSKEDAADILITLAETTADKKLRTQAVAKLYLMSTNQMDATVLEWCRKLETEPGNKNLMQALAQAHHFRAEYAEEIALREALYDSGDTEEARDLYSLYNQTSNHVGLVSLIDRIIDDLPAEQRLGMKIKRAQSQAMAGDRAAFETSYNNLLNSGAINLDQRFMLARSYGVLGDKETALNIMKDCYEEVDDAALKEGYELEILKFRLDAGETDEALVSRMSDLAKNARAQKTKRIANFYLKTIKGNQI